MKRAQALTNDKLKFRGRNLVIKKKGKANTGKQLNEGTKLISDLISDDNTVAITKSGRNLTKAADSKNSRNGVGTDAIVFFHDSDKTSGVNADGTTGRPSEIGLAHELIHADNITNGTRGNTRLPNLYDPSTKGKRILKDEEVNTRARENIIRKEHGVKARMTPPPRT